MYKDLCHRSAVLSGLSVHQLLELLFRCCWYSLAFAYLVVPGQRKSSLETLSSKARWPVGSLRVFVLRLLDVGRLTFNRICIHQRNFDLRFALFLDLFPESFHLQVILIVLYCSIEGFGKLARTKLYSVYLQ